MASFERAATGGRTQVTRRLGRGRVGAGREAAALWLAALAAAVATAGVATAHAARAQGPEPALVARGFAPGRERPFVVDVDGDGRADLLTFAGGDAGHVWVAPNVAGQRCAAGQLRVSGFGVRGAPVVAADLDGDGRADVATIQSDGSVLVGRSEAGPDGRRDFALEPWPVAAPKGAGDAAAADPSATALVEAARAPGARLVALTAPDGFPDLLLLPPGEAPGAALRLANRGLRALEGPTVWGQAPGDALAGDFDGDGAGDLAWLRDDVMWVLRGRADGAGAAGAPEVWARGVAGPLLAAGDTDGDGRADLVARGAWLTSHGAGFARVPDARLAPPRGSVCDVGDFDGDGLGDLAWFERRGGARVRVVRALPPVFGPAEAWAPLGLGPGALAAVPALAGTTARADVASPARTEGHPSSEAAPGAAPGVDEGAGDDEDETASAAPSGAEGPAAGAPPGAAGPAAGAATAGAAVGADVAVVGPWLVRHDGRLGADLAGRAPSLPAGARRLALGDVDGDGEPDLVVEHAGGRLSWARGASGGAFGPFVAWAEGLGGPWALAPLARAGDTPGREAVGVVTATRLLVWRDGRAWERDLAPLGAPGTASGAAEPVPGPAAPDGAPGPAAPGTAPTPAAAAPTAAAREGALVALLVGDVDGDGAVDLLGQRDDGALVLARGVAAAPGPLAPGDGATAPAPGAPPAASAPATSTRSWGLPAAVGCALALDPGVRPGAQVAGAPGRAPATQARVLALADLTGDGRADLLVALEPGPAGGAPTDEEPDRGASSGKPSTPVAPAAPPGRPRATRLATLVWHAESASFRRLGPVVTVAGRPLGLAPWDAPPGPGEDGGPAGAPPASRRPALLLAGPAGDLLVSRLGGTLDRDGDGVPDREEVRLWGSDPSRRDTDDDGLHDGWETGRVHGPTGGLRLDLLGCTPTRRDVLLELCPDQASDLAKVARAGRKTAALFARAGIDNPDGTRGVDLRVVLGPVRTPAWPRGGPDRHGLRECFFTPRRAGLFHWMAVSTHGGGGQANLLSDHGACGGVLEATLPHELGHQLGLQHGGGRSANGIPHYPSLMNYAYNYQRRGKLSAIDYSTGALAHLALDEAALPEVVAVPADALVYLAGPPFHFRVEALPPGPDGAPRAWIDWDRDGVRDEAPVRANINAASGEGYGRREVLDEVARPPAGFPTTTEEAPVLVDVDGALALLWVRQGEGTLAARVLPAGTNDPKDFGPPRALLAATQPGPAGARPQASGGGSSPPEGDAPATGEAWSGLTELTACALPAGVDDAPPAARPEGEPRPDDAGSPDGAPRATRAPRAVLVACFVRAGRVFEARGTLDDGLVVTREVPDSSGCAPSLAARRGRAHLALRRPDGTVTLDGRPLAGVTSTVPVGLAHHPVTDDLLVVTTDAGTRRLRLWRVDPESGAVRAHEPIGGRRASDATSRRPAVVVRTDPWLPPEGEINVFHAGILDETPRPNTHMYRSYTIGDQTWLGRDGWKEDQVFNEWSYSTHGPGAALHAGHLWQATRFYTHYAGPSRWNDRIAVAPTADGICDRNLRDHDDWALVRDRGLVPSILMAPTPRGRVAAGQ